MTERPPSAAPPSSLPQAASAPPIVASAAPDAAARRNSRRFRGSLNARSNVDLAILNLPPPRGSARRTLQQHFQLRKHSFTFLACHWRDAECNRLHPIWASSRGVPPSRAGRGAARSAAALLILP